MVYFTTGKYVLGVLFERMMPILKYKWPCGTVFFFFFKLESISLNVQWFVHAILDMLQIAFKCRLASMLHVLFPVHSILLLEMTILSEILKVKGFQLYFDSKHKSNISITVW